MKIELEINPAKCVSYVKKMMQRIDIWHLLLVSFALHILMVANPSDGMVFDETYYVTASRDLLQGIGSNPEHTPLVKLFEAGMIRIFGNWWFPWRFPIVLSAMITTLAFYLLARHFLGKRYALLATAFLSLDTLFFLHGIMYLLDMPSIMFGITGFLLYVKGKPKWAALSMALSFLSKEIGIFFVATLLVYIVYVTLRKNRSSTPKGRRDFKKFLSSTLVFILITGSTVLGFMWIYEFSFKVPQDTTTHLIIHQNIVVDENRTPLTTQIWTETITNITSFITNPIQHLMWMIKYHGVVALGSNINEYRSYKKPWNWIFPFDPFGMLDHPHYFTVSVTTGGQTFYPIDYQAQGTLPIWYATLPVVLLMCYQVLKKRNKELAILLLSWFFISIGTYTFLELLKNSTGYSYYFIYTIPMVCLGIAHFWKSVFESRRVIGIWRTVAIGLLGLQLLSTLVFFIAYFPLGFFRL